MHAQFLMQSGGTKRNLLVSQSRGCSEKQRRVRSFDHKREEGWQQTVSNRCHHVHWRLASH